jgi:hypothetical protein
VAIQGLTPEEQHLIEGISRDHLWKDTTFIGSRYRESGSNEEKEVVDYIVDQLKEAGIGDIRIYEVVAYVSYHREADCEVIFPVRRRIPAIARAYTESTPPEGLELELVVADQYEGDVTDKAVLTARDWPGGDKARRARVQIHAQVTREVDLHRGGNTPVWGIPSTHQAHLLKTEPTGINISRPDAEFLRELARQSPVRIRVRTVVETGWRRTVFPVARIPGRMSRFVLAGGHLDGHDPGATDNATGCASLLEIARIFARRRSELRHGLVVGWWTGHESAGYVGSTWFCDNEWEDLYQNGVFVLTIDGPGIRGATKLEARYVFPQTQKFIVDLVRVYFGREPDLVAKPIKMGDQSFWGVGVPGATVYRCLAPDHPDWAVVFGAGHGRWWHSTEDTLDKVDPEILTDDTRFYALLLYRLCTVEVLPFEFVTYARWMKGTLENIQRRAGPSFDFGELFRRLAELERLAQALQVAELAAHTQEAKDRINGCKMRLSRYLNPVYFTREGPYHHDLRTAIPGPPVRYPTPGEPPFEPDYFPGLQPAKRLPALDPSSGDYWVLYSTLLRERNRVLHALDQAIRDLSETLAGV